MELEYILQYVGLVLVQHLQQSTQLADFRLQLLDREQHGILLFNIRRHVRAATGRNGSAARATRDVDHGKENGRRAVACNLLLAHPR
ncbi:hypothetical protein SM139_0191 [Stenotrophomonas maltophilia]|nr:hypothetical protein SM139_0191 [Stenotrophomonas maltophilia]